MKKEEATNEAKPLTAVEMQRVVSQHRLFMKELRDKVYSGDAEIWDELDGCDAVEIAREMLDRAIKNLDRLVG